MPNVPGGGILRQLSAPSLTCRVILLPRAIEKEETLTAIQLGARGVVLKDTPPQLLLNSTRWVMDGRYWIGRDQSPILLRLFRLPCRLPERLGRATLSRSPLATNPVLQCDHACSFGIRLLQYLRLLPLGTGYFWLNCW